MSRFIAALAAALLFTPAMAQEAGSQIRATPQVPQPMNPASAEASSAPTTKAGICDRLEVDARNRCLQQQREPAAVRESARDRSASGVDSGPGSTGMGSGAGTGASGSGGGSPR